MIIQELSAAAVSESNIAEGMCFTCGGVPSTGAGEHVIPKWLQRKFKLYDERLTLINGTLIAYRNLTVPCCKACNNGFLSNIEGAVQHIFEQGMVNSYDEKLALGRWLSKILIGFLVKETSLALDRAKPELGPIIRPNFIDDLHHCHFVLQSSRKPTSFRCLHGELPFSLYFYGISDTEENGAFDLSTNVVGQSVAIRVGHLGVVFVSDGGLQMHVGPKGPYALSGSTITKIQFREICARVHYKAALRDATHLYLTFENEELIQIEQAHVKSYSGFILGSEALRIFRDWDEEEFSFALAAYTRCERSDVFDPETRMCRTTLADHDGKPLSLRDYILPTELKIL